MQKTLVSGLSEPQIAELRARINTGDKKAKVARDFGISRETLYQYLRLSDTATAHSPLAKEEST